MVHKMALKRQLKKAQREQQAADEELLPAHIRANLALEDGASAANSAKNADLKAPKRRLFQRPNPLFEAERVQQQQNFVRTQQHEQQLHEQREREAARAASRKQRFEAKSAFTARNSRGQLRLGAQVTHLLQKAQKVLA